MDLPKETEDFLRELGEYSLGLPVSIQTLQLKLRASEESQQRLKNQCLSLQLKLREKDQAIERSRAEASMNAQALKKFVEENQKLAKECEYLLGNSKKWEKECSLYERDRDALMDFGNEADERAKVAEGRVSELEEDVRILAEELNFYKCQNERNSVGTSSQDVTSAEETLLETLLLSAVGKEDCASVAHAFLTANCEVDTCQKLLKLWNCGGLKPVTQQVLALVAEFKSLEVSKEHVRVNLNTAEEEVNVLFEQNKVLDQENKRLMRKLLHVSESAGKHSGSVSAKGNKRKCSPKLCSPVEKKIDFSDADTVRQPLSPLQPQFSPERRVVKK